ncbi:MAG: flavodoxin family protein [Bacteroidales bacterium]|nr:flavodoxin family protein [Bacteroidales bacterium]
MKYMIVYSSITGNTQIIAKAIKDVLNENNCIYYGKPDGLLTQDVKIVFVGFWVLRGSCPEEIKLYLRTLENKKIFLFGTAGFGGSETYYEGIMAEVKQYISESNIIVDSFMCQGKMTKNVLERYQKLLKEKPEDDNILNMINNYKDALLHPDADDVEAIKSLVKRTFNNNL